MAEEWELVLVIVLNSPLKVLIMKYLVFLSFVIVSLLYVISCTEDEGVEVPPKTPDCTLSASFSFSGEQTVGSEITFSSTSESAERNEWFVDDQKLSTAQIFRHTFTEAKEYTVKLLSYCGNPEAGEKEYSDSSIQKIEIACGVLPIGSPDVRAEIELINGNSISGNLSQIICDPCENTCGFTVEGSSLDVFFPSSSDTCPGFISLFLQPLVKMGKTHLEPLGLDMVL